MSAPSTSRRRWLSGRRALLLLGLVAAVLVAWELRFLLERQNARHDDRYWLVTVAEARRAAGRYSSQSLAVSVPFWRRWLGDEAIVEVGLAADATDADVAAARRLFPEARQATVIAP